MTSPPPSNSVKPSWPLLTLAALSFIPGFGFIFGAVAVSWALMSKRPRARLAGVIAVVGVLLNVAGGGLMLWKMKDTPEFAASQALETHRDLAKLVEQLEAFHAQHGAYPPTLQVLVGFPIPVRLVNINDMSAGLGHLPVPYHYLVATDGNSYDLSARGPDGVPGTEDDIRPVLSDSVQAHSGYRRPR